MRNALSNAIIADDTKFVQGYVEAVRDLDTAAQRKLFPGVSLNEAKGRLLNANPSAAKKQTLLHLACSHGSEGVFEVLLGEPLVDVNAVEEESGYTPLHILLLLGRIGLAIQLLKMRGKDVDLTVRDKDGLTSSLLFSRKFERQLTRGTNVEPGLDVYTWGSGRNYTLGMPDTADRSNPDRV